MDWKLFGQLVATFSVTAVGWWVAYYFSKRRDIENDRRKLRTEYLLEAYRKLQNASHRVGSEKIYNDALESAISDIQLLGTERQSRLAAQFSLDMAEKGVAYMDDLLLDLRNELRVELNLEPLSNPSRVLRFYDKDKPSPIYKGELNSPSN
jgi:hypothetical protein